MTLMLPQVRLPCVCSLGPTSNACSAAATMPQMTNSEIMRNVCCGNNIAIDEGQAKALIVQGVFGLFTFTWSSDVTMVTL